MAFREQQAAIFQEADRRYAELKRRHEPGEVYDEQFDTERQRLMIYGDEGRWWAKSGKAGQWTTTTAEHGSRAFLQGFTQHLKGGHLLRMSAYQTTNRRSTEAPLCLIISKW